MAGQNTSGTAADRVVAGNIRTIRSRRRISAEDVAGRLDCSVGSYEAVEAGRVRLSAETLYDLANFLQCRISDFFATRLDDARPPVQAGRGFVTPGRDGPLTTEGR